MNPPTITAGRVTIAQCEDGSLLASIRRTSGPQSRIAGQVSVPAAQLERWVLRLMRAELLPVRDVFRESAPGALDEVK